MPTKLVVFVFLILLSAPAKAITRCEVMSRAQGWVNAKVPYNQSGWYGGYRTDCSGYVSMAWKLGSSQVTSTLYKSSSTLGSFNYLRPGDAVNRSCCHVVLFKQWVKKGVSFLAYEHRNWGTVAGVYSWSVSYAKSKGYVPIRRHSIKECAPANKAPIGYLDGADKKCSAVHGWAQDPDTPSKALSVHVYFNGPAGSKGAYGTSAGKANIHRADLCKAIKSCKHGFKRTIPVGLRDKKTHKAYAYTFDSKTGNPTKLKGYPRKFKCSPPPVPLSPSKAQRRWVTGPSSFSKWKLSLYHIYHVTSAKAKAYPSGKSMPTAPVLVRAKGAPEVWVIDNGQRRHVQSPAIMKVWGFSWSKVLLWSKSKVNKYAKGLAWPKKRVAIISPKGTVYLLDTRPPPTSKKKPPAKPAPPKPDKGAPPLKKDSSVATAPDSGVPPVLDGSAAPGADSGAFPAPDSGALPGLDADTDLPPTAQPYNPDMDGGCGVGATADGPVGGLTCLLLLLIIVWRRSRGAAGSRGPAWRRLW